MCYPLQMAGRRRVPGRAEALRYSSPGYLVERDDGLFLGDHPNDVRLPRYARLDVRAARTFRAAGRRVTLFVDVANVLNRTNVGLANGFIRPETGEAIGFTKSLLPRLPTAGLTVEF